MSRNNNSVTMSQNDGPALDFRQQINVESAWITALQQIRAGSLEIVLSSSMCEDLGSRGVSMLADRFSSTIGAAASLLHDPSTNVIRILPPPMFQPSSEQSKLPSTASSPTQQTSTGNNRVNTGKVSKARLAKVPRPPNAFILYRQHHHPRILAENPGIHNNRISEIIGRMWKTEDPVISDEWKMRAAERAEKHRQEYPDYEYQPRRSGERSRRVRRAAARQNNTTTSAAANPTTSHALTPPGSSACGSEFATTNSSGSESMKAGPTTATFTTESYGKSKVLEHDYIPGTSELLIQMASNYNETGMEVLKEAPMGYANVIDIGRSKEVGQDIAYWMAHGHGNEGYMNPHDAYLTLPMRPSPAAPVSSDAHWTNTAFSEDGRMTTLCNEEQGHGEQMTFDFDDMIDAQPDGSFSSLTDQEFLDLGL